MTFDNITLDKCGIVETLILMTCLSATCSGMAALRSLRICHLAHPAILLIKRIVVTYVVHLSCTEKAIMWYSYPARCQCLITDKMTDPPSDFSRVEASIIPPFHTVKSKLAWKNAHELVICNIQKICNRRACGKGAVSDFE